MSTTNEDAAQDDVPFHIHEFIGRTTEALEEGLRQHIVSVIGKPDDKVRINLLWNNPRLGCHMYFVPITKPVHHIGGLESEYYRTLLSLRPLPMPDPDDQQALLEYAMCCPQALSALANLIAQDTKGILRGGHDRPLPTPRSVMRDLLALFTALGQSDPGTVEAVKCDTRIQQLANANNDLLQRIVYCMLTVVPQFEGAKGTCWEEQLDPWIPKGQKCAKWKEGKMYNNSPTRFFYLLSLIESLQWHSNTLFGVIPNLFTFLLPTTNGPCHKYITRNRVFLSRLGLYWTCSDRSTLTSVKANIVETMRQTLTYEVDRLCALVHAITFATYRSNLETFDDVQNCHSEALAQGFLNIANPTQLVAYHHYPQANNDGDVNLPSQNTERRLPLYSVRLHFDHPHAPEAQTAGSIEVRDCLRSGWGIYSTPSPSPTWVPKLGTHQLRCEVIQDELILIDPPNNTPDVEVHFAFDGRESGFLHTCVTQQLFVGDLFAQFLRWPWQIDLHSSREWYKKAFGKFYCAFDKARHKYLEEHNLDGFDKRMQETPFYHTMLTKHAQETDGHLRVLDIGIGYGRLEERILPIPQCMVTLSGVDISRAMARRAICCCERLNIGANLTLGDIKVGEMKEIAAMFKESLQDVVILAFTTFGCYSNNEDNADTLKAIAKILRPGGLLIVEQFNPNRTTPDQELLELPFTIEDDPEDQDYRRNLFAVKTTEYVHSTQNVDCTLYTGDYFYYDRTVCGRRLIRHDHYCVRLYTEQWFRAELKNAGFDDESLTFHGDFDWKQSYKHCPVDARSIVLLARKRKDALCSVSQDMIDDLFEDIVNCVGLLSRHAASELRSHTLLCNVTMSTLREAHVAWKNSLKKKWPTTDMQSILHSFGSDLNVFNADNVPIVQKFLIERVTLLQTKDNHNEYPTGL